MNHKKELLRGLWVIIQDGFHRVEVTQLLNLRSPRPRHILNGLGPRVS